MQKLAKRTVQAQRQAGRRAEQQARRQRKTGMWQARAAVKGMNQEIKNNLADARLARKEDWELGPLAPKRDLGFNHYGLMTDPVRASHIYNGNHVVSQRVVEKRCEWAGGSKQLNLAVGDRVVILEGPAKGKVDRIESVNTDLGTITLQEQYQGLMKPPLGGDSQALPLPISIDAVRLVYPITDPKTGVTRDSIIRELKAIPPNMQSENMTLDRWEHGNKWDRVVPGINVVIPWPEVKVPEYVTQDADTTREQVEDRTFYYNLLSPPMPSPVLDELRNKYSRFRTRHEGWYIAQKMSEVEAKKKRHELLVSMQSPAAELGIRNQEVKAAKGEPELTDEMLEKLGQIIAQTKAASLEDAGVTEVTLEKGPSEGGSTTQQ
ncbi:hypothetical protein ACO1O0_007200 [Amphichorda felina]